MGITIIRQLNRAIDTLLISAAKATGPERVAVQGVIKIHELGDMSSAEYAYWWLPEKDANGRLIRLPRLSRREKERFQVAEFHNLLTNAGKLALLTYIGSQANNSLPFGQAITIGNGAIAQAAVTDTVIAGPFYTSQLFSNTVIGTQVDLYTTFGGTSGNGTWTNVGIQGGGSWNPNVAGSGVLYTHALANYVKSAGLVACDYLMNIY